MGDELDVLRPTDTGISCRTKGLMAGRTWGVKAAEYWEWLGDALVTGKRLLGTKDMGQRAHSCQTCHVSQSAATLRGCGDRPAAARGSGEGAVSRKGPALGEAEAGPVLLPGCSIFSGYRDGIAFPSVPVQH